MMRLLKFRPLFMILPLLLIIAIAILTSQQPQVIGNPTPTASPTTTPPPTHRDLWNSRGGLNYEMVIEAVALPQPVVAQTLTILDGKVIKNSLVACDNPSEEYPARDCETLKTYYAGYGIYTIEELFESADFGLSRTRETMRKCGAAGGDMFQDFLNSDVMFAMAKTCEADLKSQDWVVLSAVEYDPYYGYPKIISSYIPGVNDGFGQITVKSFRLTENSSHKIE